MLGMSQQMKKTLPKFDELIDPTLQAPLPNEGRGPAAALQHEDTRLEASEMLRGMIDAIVLIPESGQPPSRDGDDARSREPRLRIELRGIRPRC
jgi:hypothetical protein